MMMLMRIVSAANSRPSYLGYCCLEQRRFSILPAIAPLFHAAVSACLLILMTTAHASELKVLSANLALNKPCSQSSTSQWSHGNDAQGAVDGMINGSFGFHTAQEANPWWQVDIGALYLLTEIRIYNRIDCCAERARSIEVLISPDGRAWQSAYVHNGTIFGGKDGHPLVVSVAGIRARFVRLRLNITEYLHLDEVEVNGFTTEDQTSSGTTPASPATSDASRRQGGNLIANGDFNQGNVGFISEFKHSPGSVWDAATYAVNVDAKNVHGSFAGRDHTTGSGNFLIINGAENKVVWSQTVSVTPGTDYDLSFWLASVYTENPAILSITVNGQNVGSATAPAAVNEWRRFGGRCNSGSSSTAEIKILIGAAAYSGCDFGIDDISFSAVDTGCVANGSTSSTSVTPPPTGRSGEVTPRSPHVKPPHVKPPPRYPGNTR